VIGPVPAAATAPAVHDLYQSLLGARRHARRQLQTMRDIERAHRSTPLAELAGLAVAGALQPPDLDDGVSEQP
jgi:hypothetical protein